MSIGCVGEIPYAELGARLVGGEQNRRIPLSGSWDVTERCNLACTHCYINRPVGDALSAERELTTGEVCSILDEIAAEGCLWLTFTGGEPFLRQDMLDIYRHAKRLGLLVTLFTNGTLLTPEIVDALTEWRPYRIEITLYGATAPTYERISGVRGSFSRCMRGIELVRERGLPLALKTMVLTLNEHELGAMKAWADERALEFRWDAELTPRLDGNRRSQATRLPAARRAAIDVGHAERAAEWQALVRRERAWQQRAGPVEQPSHQADLLFQCGAGLRSFQLDAYGGLSLCGLARRPSYDLREGTFRDGWQQFLAVARSAQRRKRSPCADCGIGSLCSQCPGWAQLVHGDNETVVEDLCEVAHLRAESLFGSPDIV